MQDGGARFGHRTLGTPIGLPRHLCSRSALGDAVVSDHTIQALAGIPPDWIGLTEVVQWVQRRFGIDISELLPDLSTALRKSELRYRIAGLTIYDLGSWEDSHTRGGWDDSVITRTEDGEIYRRSPSYTAIPGLTNSLLTGDVIVCDWNAAGVDWPTGTVMVQKEGNPSSHRIEIWWLDLEEWTKSKLPLLKQQRDGGMVPVGTTPPPPDLESPRPSGLPAELAKDPIISIAYDEMYRYASDYFTDKGVPPKRDDVAKVGSEKGKISFRMALKLYRDLPNHLRNPPRTRSS